MFIGIVLILMGVLFLLKNLGFLSGNLWGIFWPIIVIAMGFRFLFEKNRISNKRRPPD